MTKISETQRVVEYVLDRSGGYLDGNDTLLMADAYADLQALAGRLLDQTDRLRQLAHALVRATHSGTMASCGDLGCIEHQKLLREPAVVALLATQKERVG